MWSGALLAGGCRVFHLMESLTTATGGMQRKDMDATKNVLHRRGRDFHT